MPSEDIESLGSRERRRLKRLPLQASWAEAQIEASDRSTDSGGQTGRTANGTDSKREYAVQLDATSEKGPAPVAPEPGFGDARYASSVADGNETSSLDTASSDRMNEAEAQPCTPKVPQLRLDKLTGGLNAAFKNWGEDNHLQHSADATPAASFANVAKSKPVQDKAVPTISFSRRRGPADRVQDAQELQNFSEGEEGRTEEEEVPPGILAQQLEQWTCTWECGYLGLYEDVKRHEETCHLKTEAQQMETKKTDVQKNTNMAAKDEQVQVLAHSSQQLMQEKSVEKEKKNLEVADDEAIVTKSRNEDSAASAAGKKSGQEENAASTAIQLCVSPPTTPTTTFSRRKGPDEQAKESSEIRDSKHVQHLQSDWKKATPSSDKSNEAEAQPGTVKVPQLRLDKLTDGLNAAFKNWGEDNHLQHASYGAVLPAAGAVCGTDAKQVKNSLKMATANSSAEKQRNDMEINEAQEKKSHDPIFSGNVLEGSTADAITAAAATQQPAQEEKKKDDIRAGAKDRLGNARVLLRRFGTGRDETGPENGQVDPTPEPKTEAHKSDTKEHRSEQLKSADKVADEMKETHNLVKVNTERPQLTPRAGPSAAGMVVAAAASSLSSISSAPSSITSPPRALTPRQQVLVTAAWRLAQEAEAEKRAEEEKILLSKVEEDLALKERQAASAAAAAAAAASEKTIEVDAPTTHIQESPERAAAEERRRKQEKALRAHKEEEERKRQEELKAASKEEEDRHCQVKMNENRRAESTKLGQKEIPSMLRTSEADESGDSPLPQPTSNVWGSEIVGFSEVYEIITSPRDPSSMEVEAATAAFREAEAAEAAAIDKLGMRLNAMPSNSTVNSRIVHWSCGVSLDLAIAPCSVPHTPMSPSIYAFPLSPRNPTPTQRADDVHFQAIPVSCTQVGDMQGFGSIPFVPIPLQGAMLEKKGHEPASIFVSEREKRKRMDDNKKMPGTEPVLLSPKSTTPPHSKTTSTSGSPISTQFQAVEAAVVEAGQRRNSSNFQPPLLEHTQWATVPEKCKAVHHSVDVSDWDDDGVARMLQALRANAHHDIPASIYAEPSIASVASTRGDGCKSPGGGEGVFEEPIVSVKGNGSHKLWGCSYHCAFHGSFEEVTSHEASCSLRKTTDAARAAKTMTGTKPDAVCANMSRGIGSAPLMSHLNSSEVSDDKDPKLTACIIEDLLKHNGELRSQLQNAVNDAEIMLKAASSSNFRKAWNILDQLRMRVSSALVYAPKLARKEHRQASVDEMLEKDSARLSEKLHSENTQHEPGATRPDRISPNVTPHQDGSVKTHQVTLSSHRSSLDIDPLQSHTSHKASTDTSLQDYSQGGSPSNVKSNDTGDARSDPLIAAMDAANALHDWILEQDIQDERVDKMQRESKEAKLERENKESAAKVAHLLMCKQLGTLPTQKKRLTQTQAHVHTVPPADKLPWNALLDKTEEPSGSKSPQSPSPKSRRNSFGPVDSPRTIPEDDDLSISSHGTAACTEITDSSSEYFSESDDELTEFHCPIDAEDIDADDRIDAYEPVFEGRETYLDASMNTSGARAETSRGWTSRDTSSNADILTPNTKEHRENVVGKQNNVYMKILKEINLTEGRESGTARDGTSAKENSKSADGKQSVENTPFEESFLGQSIGKSMPEDHNDVCIDVPCVPHSCSAELSAEVTVQPCSPRQPCAAMRESIVASPIALAPQTPLHAGNCDRKDQNDIVDVRKVTEKLKKQERILQIIEKHERVLLEKSFHDFYHNAYIQALHTSNKQLQTQAVLHTAAAEQGPGDSQDQVSYRKTKTLSTRKTALDLIMEGTGGNLNLGTFISQVQSCSNGNHEASGVALR